MGSKWFGQKKSKPHPSQQEKCQDQNLKKLNRKHKVNTPFSMKNPPWGFHRCITLCVTYPESKYIEWVQYMILKIWIIIHQRKYSQRLILNEHIHRYAFRNNYHQLDNTLPHNTMLFFIHHCAFQNRYSRSNSYQTWYAHSYYPF